MNRRFLPLIIGSLLLPLGCGGDPTGPFPTLVATTTSLPNGAPSVAYSETLTATGGDGSYTWSLTVGSLPTGLSLAASGDITGTPTVAETGSFTVQVASGDGQTAQQALSITVITGGGPPVITTSVNVVDFAFAPPDIQVAPGATVRWTWTGSLSHNVTFTSTSIANSVTQTSGTYAVAMPNATGVYAYRCTIHGFTGSVTVP